MLERNLINILKDVELQIKKKDAYKENMNAPLVKITFLYIFMYVCSYYNKLRRRAYMYVCIYV